MLNSSCNHYLNSVYRTQMCRFTGDLQISHLHLEEDHQYSSCIKRLVSSNTAVSSGNEAMEACDFCGNNRDGKGDAVSFYRYPLDEENRRSWIANMGRDAEWTPSESSFLCSAHFTSDCFESGSAHLHQNAIPTLFSFTQPMNLNTENVSQEQGAPSKSTDSSLLSPCCDCNKRLHTIEKAYQLKIAAAQLQIKEYKKRLTEESQKATQWQKRAIVLQSAIRAMRLKGSLPTRRKSSPPKANYLD